MTHIRSIKILVMLFVIMTLFFAFGIVASADSWYVSGDGSESNPYIIENMAGLNAFAIVANNETVANEDRSPYKNFKNLYIKLSDNFDSTGEQTVVISAEFNSRFAGTFDGNGKTVNINVAGSSGYSGMFGCLDIMGTVKNISVSGAVKPVATTYSFAGGIVGLNNGGYIYNCNSNITITASGTSAHSGGIVGENNGIIRNCSTIGNVTANSSPYAFAGGIAGDNRLDTTTVPKIENCSSEVVVNANTNTSDGDARAYSGGIVGQNGSSSQSVCIIENSNSNSSVKASAKAGWSLVGGIAGENNGTIKFCSSDGNCSAANGSVLFIGGIVGYELHVTDSCFSNSTISAITSKDNYLGGIAGSSSGDVINCGCTGDIMLKLNASVESYVGGITGTVGNGNVKNSFYLGSIECDVKDRFNIGCISGSMSGGNISNCYSLGKKSVKHTNSYISPVGGILGYFRSDNQSDITYCYTLNGAGGGTNTLIGYYEPYHNLSESSKATLQALSESAIKASSGSEGALIDKLNQYVSNNPTAGLTEWKMSAEMYPVISHCGHKKTSHDHAWSVTCEGGIITLSCANSDGLHVGTICQSIMIDRPAHAMENDGLSPVAVITNKTSEIVTPTVYYEGVYPTVYEKTSIAPETKGIYKASIEIEISGTTYYAVINYVIAKTPSIIRALDDGYFELDWPIDKSGYIVVARYNENGQFVGASVTLIDIGASSGTGFVPTVTGGTLRFFLVDTTGYLPITDDVVATEN